MNSETEPHLTLLQRIIHIVLTIVGWIIYGFFVYRLLNEPKELLVVLLLLILVVAIVSPVAIYLWIRHNIHIFKTHKPRSHPPHVAETYTEDWDHRKIVADWSALKAEKFINVLIEDKEKKFVPGQVSGGTG
jgi:hypothetical protein